MMEKNDEVNNSINEKNIIDITRMTNEELVDFYSKVSENILMLNNLLNKNDKEEAIKKYTKIKNKL